MKCTCVLPSVYNDPDRPGYGRHEFECACAPNLEGWLFYPHDGELEGGGIYVHPADRSCVYLLIDDYLCRVPRQDGDASDEVEAAND
jgi:hypothetical protein